jgi:peptide/nickel transport system substrate-binding protein
LHVAPVLANQLDEVERSGVARTIPHRMMAYTFITWNTRKPQFQDPRVRLALTRAIDRRGIIDAFLGGKADLANSTVPSFVWQHDPEAGATLTYDPEAARSLLEEAGWRDRDGNGVLENASGQELRFTLLAVRGGPAGDLIEKVAADLQRVGVVAKPRLLEGTTMWGLLGDKERNFDAAISGLQAQLRVPMGRDGFHCDALQGYRQYSGICDEELDRLLDTIPLIMDPAAAKPLWNRYQHKLSELQPYTFLYHRQNLLGVSNQLRNVKPDARGPLVGASRWWLLPDQRGNAARPATY